jgi:hypothetical protein
MPVCGLIGLGQNVSSNEQRTNVRCWGRNGKHLIAARISHFDPTRTFDEVVVTPVVGLPSGREAGANDE